jgi:predicted acetyltransferase
MLMRWGIEQIDERGIESFIEATPAGQALYEKYGYLVVKSVHVDMSHVSVDSERMQEWKDLERRFLPLSYVALWRPVRGVQNEDEFRKIWQERLSW